MNSIIKRNTNLIMRKRISFITCLLWCVLFTNISKAEIVNLPCQSDTDGFIGLDRKNWNNGSTAAHSEGSLHNFDLPISPEDCKVITNVQIDITVINVDISGLTCTPPGAYYINIATGCPSFDPASCDPSNLVDEPNNPNFNSQSLSYNSPPEDFQFGDNLSIDIVPVMDVNCPNGQSAISSGEIILEYEICVTLTISDETIDISPDLGLGITICPNSTTTLDPGSYVGYEWGPNGETTPTIDVGPGSYVVTVTDANGCTDEDDITITPFPTSSISFDPVAPAVCDDGLVNVSINETFMSYNWSNGLSGQTVSLSSGTYQVTITDNNNCTAESAITISNVAPPNAGIDNFIDVCNDGSLYDMDALLLAHDPGGTWSDDNFSGVDINIDPMNTSFIGLASGDYQFTYSVAGNAPCPPDDAIITVRVFEQSFAGTSNTVQFCPDPGNLDFNQFLNNPDAGGSWTNINNAPIDLTNTFAVNFNGVTEGTYEFEYLISSNGPCVEQSAILTVVIQQGDSAGEDNEATVCEGTEFNLETLINGATTSGFFIDSDVSGGLSGSIVNTTGLAGSSFDFTFVVGSPGSSCGEDQAIFILNIESNLTAGVGTMDSTCIGGEIDLYDFITNEDQGGIFSDQNASGGLTGNILDTENITPGIYNYQYEIGDGVTCPISTTNIELTFFTDPTFSFDQDQIFLCESLCDSIEIDFTGQPPYNFTIEIYSTETNNLIVSSDRTSATNSYIFTACNALDSLIFMNDSLSLFSDSTWYITIPMLSDINCTIDPISTPDTITVTTISNPIVQIDTSACITDTLVIGGIMLYDGNAEYRDTLDGIFCDSIVSINVIFSDADSIFIDPTLCPGDSIEIHGNWYSENNSADVITVSNPDGCDSVFVIDLNFYPSATNTIDAQLCSGDSIIVNNMVYNELNPNGTEIILNQSSNGCDSTIFIALQYLGDITETVDDTLCLGDFLIIGNETFDESNPTGQVILNGTGCDTIVDINLTFHQAASHTIEGTFCDDYSIVVNNITYDINNPSGMETLSNQSQFGCDSLVSIDLDFYIPSTGTYGGTYCEDFSIVINSTTYDINNQSGTETLSGASQFGCDSIVDINLAFGPSIVTPFASSICENDSIEVNGTFYHAGNTTGSEIFIGGSASGCDSLVEVQLTILQTYEFTVEEIRCQGDSIFAEGAWQFQAGMYTDILQTSNFCDSIVITELTLNDCQTSVNINVSDNACAAGENGNISLDIESEIPVPFTITWEGVNTGNSGSQIISISQNPIDISDLISDNYTIRIIDTDGMIIYENTATVTDSNPAINGTWQVIDSILCADDLATIEFTTVGGQGPYQYDWSQSAIGNTSIAENVPSGGYQLTITDDLGCIYETAFTVDDAVLFEALYSSLDPLCLESIDGEIEVTTISGGTLPYTITFNNAITQELLFTNLDTGTYVIELIDANNCMVTITEELMVASSPMLGDYTLAHTITQGDSIVLDGTTFGGTYTFNWIDEITSLSCTDCANPTASPDKTTTYTLDITDENGCQETIMILVNVNEIIVQTILPNVFSPNGDNSNDDFIFINFNDDVLDIHMLIYDRWGNKVYENESSDNSISWDGTKNGIDLDSGVYVYSLTITNTDGQVEQKFGDVLLIR